MAATTTAQIPGSMPFHSPEGGMAGSPAFAAEDESAPRPSPTAAEEQLPRVSSPNRPTPLPSFVFPMKSGPTSPSPRSAPSSFSRATGRRPVSAFELSGPTDRQNENEGEGGRETLPDFSFGSLPQSPPLSPRTIPGRSGFHKRGTSEFIGGDGKTGNGAGLMSTSPTKGDNMLPSPNPSISGPPNGRRGHAHRRSAAISCHDLSMILKPDPTIARGGASAPTSPSAEEHKTSPLVGSLDASILPPNSPEDSSPVTESIPPMKAFNRNRVGFSDFVDIIPRPLSVVSSDSASTVRQGHSVTGSMSSIISAGTSSPQPKEKRVSSGLSTQTTDVRPKSAEPSTERDATRSPETPRRRNSIPLLAEAAAASSTSAPSTPRSAKKWAFFGHEPGSGETSPKSRPTSSASSDKEPRRKSVESAPLTPDRLSSTLPMQSIEPSTSRRSSLTKKPSKKQKKVRSWAGSILSRKSRQRSQKLKLSRRSPTPPLRGYTPVEDSRDFIFNDPELLPERPKSDINTDFASWKPRRLPTQEESISPIIDLDAALGPFNTPSSFGEDWTASQRAGNRKRVMHSAAGLGGFSGPGMHYHRRAESAPEFENPRFALHRLGSAPSMGMEDVFEEENEDEDWEDTKASDKESISRGLEDDDEASLGIDIKVVDSDGLETDRSMDFEDASFQRGVKRKGSGLSETERWHVSSTKSIHSNRSLIDEPITEESSPVEIVDDSIPPRSDSGSRSSDSTATPPLRPAAKELAPVDIQPFTLQLPYPTPTSPRSITQSSIPSPRSPYSYDTQRISTAPSSVTDEQGFQSLLLGEPGPEVRMSVDDVPSLTSSNSTMTRDGSIPWPTPANGAQFRDGQRSASLSSAAVSRKRSSMASLSRLISSSHGEKSKLSIESRPSTSEGMEKKEKTSRGKRISRMMQFWKPKDL